MPTPFRAADLSPQMRERYGLDRRDWVTTIVVVGLIGLFLALLAWIALGMGSSGVQHRLVSWTITSPTQVDVTFEVRPPEGRTAYCVVRAQDSTRTDVGYRIVEIPSDRESLAVTTSLTTLIPAYTVEILGCALDAPPPVVPPQFPPGVVPPA